MTKAPVQVTYDSAVTGSTAYTPLDSVRTILTGGKIPLGYYSKTPIRECSNRLSYPTNLFFLFKFIELLGLRYAYPRPIVYPLY